MSGKTRFVNRESGKFFDGYRGKKDLKTGKMEIRLGGCRNRERAKRVSGNFFRCFKEQNDLIKGEMD